MRWNGWFTRGLERRERLKRSVLKLERLEERVVLNSSYFKLFEADFSQNWSGTNAALTTSDDWQGIASIEGFLGDGMTPTATTTDPQVVTGDAGSLDIIPNSNSTSGTGGVHEIADNVVALQGSGAAIAPYLAFYLDATNRSNLRISYNLVELDGTTVDQKFALQYRLGDTGPWTNIPAGAVSGVFNAAGNQTQAVSNVSIPSAVNNQSQVQVRVITHDAPSSDAMVGIDDIVITSSPLDTTPPTVLSIVRAGTSPTNASSVDYTVTFSEDVTGVGTADFALTTSGVSGASVTNVSQVSGGVYTVSVNTGSGDGTIRLDLIDDDSITDAAGNRLGGTGTSGAGNGSFTTGQTYTIDKTPPAVTSIVRLGSSPTNAASVDFLVVFNDSVSGVGTADFALTTSGVSGASVTSVTPAGPANAYTVTVSTGSGDGTIRLDLIDDDSVADAAGNRLGGTGLGNGSFTVGEIYTIDKTPPTVQSITRLNSNPTNAATVSFTVLFSQPVNGFDPSDLTLTTAGLSGVSIVEILGSPTTPDWTVTVNTGSGDGTIRLDLTDDDSVADAAGNRLGGTGLGNGSFTAGEIYTIDKSAPTVSSIVRLDSSPTAASTVRYTVTFSESVSGVNLGDFTLNTTGLSGAGVASVSAGPSASYTVTVSTGSGSGTLGLNLIDDDTVADAAGNKLGGTGLGNGNFTGEVYLIDRTGPTVTSIVRSGPSPTNAASVDYTVTFSEAVTGVDAADFVVDAAGVSGASVGAVNGSGATWTVSVGTGTGSGTLSIDVPATTSVADALGNALTAAFTDGEAYLIDKMAPSVTSIVRAGSSPTSAASVDFTVTFSEVVSGVDETDFALAVTGLSGAGVVSVSAGPSDTYTVTVNTGTGSGTLGLNLVDNDSITDAATNALAGPGAGNGNFTGEVYLIDRAAPSAVSINRKTPAGPATNAASVTWEVKFSEAVTGVDAADFALTGATGGTSITAVNGSGDTWTVTAATGAEGLLGLNLVDGDSILDAVSQPLGGPGAGNGAFIGDEYTIDKTAPSVQSIARLSPTTTATNAATVQFRVTFSEAVTGFDPSDFRLNPTLVPLGTVVSDLTGSGSTYTVTITTGADGVLDPQVLDDDTIVDAAGNTLNGAFLTGGEIFQVDKTPPAVPSIVLAGSSLTNAASVTFDVRFDEAVTGVDPTDFAVVTTGLSGAMITDVTFSSGFHHVTVSTGTGSGTLGLNVVDDDTIADSATNPLGGPGAGNGNATGPEFTIDRTAPSVVSITRAGSSPTNASSVDFTITFSESVTGVDPTAFSVSGSAGGSVSGVSGSGTTWTVTVTPAAEGTVGLNVVDDDSIGDGVGNPLAAGFTGTAFYTIDRTAPTVSSIRRLTPTGPATNASDVTFEVTFSESVTGVGPGDLALTGSATAATLGTISGSGTTYQVGVTVGAVDGTLGLNLVDDDSIRDDAGNALAGNFTGEAYTIDRVAPTVLSITRVTASPSNLDEVQFLVAFSEPVVNAGVSGFAVDTAGLGGTPAVTDVSGSGNTRTVTVSTGTGGDGVTSYVTFQIAATAVIADPAGNALAASAYTPERIFIDRTAPTVASITDDVAGGPVSPGTAITYTVTFSEDVRDGTFSAADLTSTGSAAVSFGAVSETSPGVFSVLVTPTGAGTVRLTIPAGASVEDAAGNRLAVPAFDDTTITAAYQPPVLTVVGDQGASEGTALTLPGIGTFIDLDGSTGGPFSFTIDWGDNTTPDTGTPGAGTIGGQHTYADDGVYTVTVTVADANGGSDSESFEVTVTNVAPTLTVVADQLTDEDVPLTLADVGTFTDPGFADTFTYTIDWGEGPVQGPFAATIDVPGGPGVLRRGSFDGSHTYANPGVYTVNVTVTDDNLGSDSKTFQVTVNDTTPPSVVNVVRAGSSPTNAASVDFTVTFSEAVTGVGTEDFAPFTTGTLSGISVTNVATISPSVYTVTVAVGGGTGTLRLDVPGTATVQDLGGNALAAGFSGGESYAIDRTVPTVVNIVRAGTSPTSAASVDFTITFSESVSGVDLGDFTLTGLIGASIASVSAGPSDTYTVTVNTGTGSGTLGLNLVDNDSITDALGNALGGPGADNGNFTGEVYTIDHTAPTVVGITRVSASPTNLGAVQFLVTFSEDVTGVDADDFAVDASGLSGASVGSASGLGTTWTVSVSTGSGQGILSIDVPATASIADALGNALAAAFTTGQAYDIDRTAPSVVSITRAGSSPTNAASVVFTVTFSEAVSGVDAGDFAVVAPGLNGAGVTGVNPVSTSVYEVTVSTGTGEGTLRLDAVANGSVTDAVDNVFAAGFTAGQAVDIDTIGPAVTSISRLDPSPTAAATVRYQVTFREAVTGVDRSDFALTAISLLPPASIQSVDGSGTTYTVTVSTGGDGSFRLGVLNDGTITDTVGNALTAAFTAGDAYDVVKPPTEPAVVSLVPNDTGVPTTTAGAIRLRRGQELTLTATVAEVGTSGARTVTFLQNGTPVATIGLVGNVAQIVIAGLRVGDYAFTARYDGDNKHLPGTSSAVLVEVDTANTLFVIQAYDDLTGRDESPRTAALIAALDAGTMNRTEVVMALLHTPEYYARAVRDAYERLLHRPPTTKELNARVGLLAAGQTVPQLEAWLLGSPEYFTRRGRTAAGFRAAVIHDLTAGVFSVATRRALAAGLRAVAPGGGLTTQAARTSFVIALVRSPFGRTATVQSLFGRFLGRPADGRLRAFATLLRFERGYDQVEAALLASATYAP